MPRPRTTTGAREGRIASRRRLSVKSDAPKGGSGLESHLAQSMRSGGLPEPEREYRFHPTRRWRLDFAWPSAMLAVEVEGGVYRGGGHSSVAGIKRDLEKGNALTLLGWRLLRFHGDQVRSGEATEIIKQALKIEPRPSASDAGDAGE